VAFGLSDLSLLKSAFRPSDSKNTFPLKFPLKSLRAFDVTENGIEDAISVVGERVLLIRRLQFEITKKLQLLIFFPGYLNVAW
jgi:hypothetical protein